MQIFLVWIIFSRRAPSPLTAAYIRFSDAGRHERFQRQGGRRPKTLYIFRPCLSIATDGRFPPDTCRAGRLQASQRCNVPVSRRVGEVAKCRVNP